MTSPGPANTSQTARLTVDPPGFAVGWQEPVYLVNPPAGSGWSHTVDGKWLERLISARWIFTADAVVANRSIRLSLLDVNGTIVTEVPATGVVTAGTMLACEMTTGGPGYAVTVAGVAAGFIPDLLVPPGWTWTARGITLDPGDTLTSITLLVQRYPNDAASITAGQ